MKSNSPVQVVLRTYTLSLSLSLGPSLLPFITSWLISRPSRRTNYQALKRVLRRELGLNGFAFAITLSVGGGAVIRKLWDIVDEAMLQDVPDKLSSDYAKAGMVLSPSQKTCIANILSSYLGFFLLQSRGMPSPQLHQDRSPLNATIPFTALAPIEHPSCPTRISNTLDLTLLLLVRAVDTVLQKFIYLGVESIQRRRDPNSSVERSPMINNPIQENTKEGLNKIAKNLTSRIDALVFWACSARIMWCFFYEPERLPQSYVKWIATLANLDKRVIQVLRLVREGHWSYIKGSRFHSHLFKDFAKELGYNPSWGDPVSLPAYGGSTANKAWKALGVRKRHGVGGVPCELVHGSTRSSLGLEASCTINSLSRGVMTFLEAIAIYLPVHFLPILLTRPHTLLKPHPAFATLLGALRSATFLSAFVTLYWYTVCITRSLIFARLFPFISHDFWDGPFGCILAGSLTCGSSIWIENGRRRGEMALYVLPRAIRACLPDTLIKNNNRIARVVERITFIMSFSTLITAAIHHPETLRGLSRWTLSFILNGPNTGFWNRKSRDHSAQVPPPPSPTHSSSSS